VIEVLAAGPLTTVQDAGRPGLAALGVAPGGAFDRAAYRAANRLVGNPEGAAVFELTLGGLAVRLHAAATVALTGAACPGLDRGAARTLPAGAVLRLGAPTSGLRSYLAVRGGIDVPDELGSRSTDTLGGLGPAALRAGDRLAVGAQPALPVAGTAAVPPARPDRVSVSPGPRLDWFVPTAWDDLLATPWTVRPDSDRIGVRLDGPPLRRRQEHELPSEATLPGAVQVPPDGRPIVFGPDGPVTGGYPVLAVVDVGAGFDALAQLRPGDTLRFAAARSAQ
jgi:biotin-dependent carboxylase-like uncharacterized protein